MGKTKSNIAKNYALPGKPMTEKEFLAFIEAGEKGPFHPVANLKKEVLALWKKKYGNSDC